MKKLIALIFFISLAQIYSLEIVDYSQGFETDISGWDVFGGSFDATRVATGTNGILSKTGSYHGQSGTAATNWGGYNSVFPSNGYTTQVDVYLDVSSIPANDKRFEFTSAVNNPSGSHRRDFVFNGGGYTIADGSFPTVPCFVFSASFNTAGWPKNPGRSPFAITSTGWYTLKHHFYSVGGVLNCDMQLLNASGTVLKTWTLSDPTDIIGTTVGGNRYGWFATNQLPFLAIDNSLRTHTAPTPTDVWVDDSWNSQGDVDVFNNALIWGFDAFKTIQEGIDAVASGGNVHVLPGSYDETATNRTVVSAQGNNGPHQFGLFFDKNKPGVKVIGCDASGNPITNYASVMADISTNATNDFGSSGIFVNADDIIIQGFKILDNAGGNNKTIEVIGNNFKLQYCHIDVSDGGSVYLNDWSFVSNTSSLDKYTLVDNKFDKGCSIDIASGVGYTGSVSGRLITNNVFDGTGCTYSYGVIWPSISFSGNCLPDVGWFVDPVGAAVITGNDFKNYPMYIRYRGLVDDAQFNWKSYWDNNTYDKAVITLMDMALFTVQPYSYTSGSANFSNVHRIGSVIQNELNQVAQSNDIVLIKDGTYNENLSISTPNLIVRGENPPTNTTLLTGTVNITGNGTTLMNFKIDPPNFVTPDAAVFINASNVLIKNNIILDLDAAIPGSTIKGIHIYEDGPGTISGITIEDNVIKDIDNTGVGGAVGIMTQGFVNDVKILTNEFNNITSAGWADGIDISPTDISTANTPTNVIVKYNIFKDINKTYNPSQPGVPYPGVAVLIGKTNTYNHYADPTTYHINFNNFTGITSIPFGVVNSHTTNIVDAEYNWWGHCSGPTVTPYTTILGSGATPMVDYTPWLGGTLFSSSSIIHLNSAYFFAMGHTVGTYEPDWYYDWCPGVLKAVSPSSDRNPQYTLSSPPMVEFGTNLSPEGHNWGASDVMQINYDANITSGVADIMTPTAVDKTLFVVFKPEADANNGRQVIFEAGETTSGFNIYTDNDNVCFGMWNRLERMFLHTGMPSLTMGQYYLAQLEYNATKKEFRAVVNGSIQSPVLPFSGLTKDPDDGSGQPSVGIAGEVLGTRFHDYNIRTNNYSHTYNGGIGDVILFNSHLDATKLGEVYAYFNSKYGTSWTAPAEYTKRGDWKVFSDVETNTTLSEAWPNPFSNKTSFSVMLPEKQHVRIELINSYGELIQVLYEGVMDGGIVQDVTIDGANLPSGLYVYRVMANGFNQSGKVILTK